MTSEDRSGKNKDKWSYKCLSEFLGVFILVFTVGMNIVTKSPATALSAAGALVSMIYALGYFSGAHFNPAVTLAVVLGDKDRAGDGEKCSYTRGACYVFAQLLAAILAGHLYGCFHKAGPNAKIAFPLEVAKGYSFLSAGFAELFFTFLLAYTVLATATSSTAKGKFEQTKQIFYFALAIASCVIAGGFAIGGISGGELNPAVCFGISFANLGPAGHKHHHHHGSPPVNFVPFSLWELSGAIIAAMTYRLTHAREYKSGGNLVDSIRNLRVKS
jgi:aquaporin Z